jgi:hypothetical protein
MKDCLQTAAVLTKLNVKNLSRDKKAPASAGATEAIPGLLCFK